MAAEIQGRQRPHEAREGNAAWRSLQTHGACTGGMGRSGGQQGRTGSLSQGPGLHSPGSENSLRSDLRGPHPPVAGLRLGRTAPQEQEPLGSAGSAGAGEGGLRRGLEQATENSPCGKGEPLKSVQDRRHRAGPVFWKDNL